MKTIMGVGVVVVLICGVLGVNTLKVAVNDVKEGVEQNLPAGFRLAVAEKDVETRQAQLAEAAAEVDLYVLPHYAGILGKVTFADLRQQDLKPFSNMVQNLRAGAGKLDARLCCATGTMASELESMKGKLDQLAERAANDLESLESLQAQFVQLEEKRRKLSHVNPTTDCRLKVELNTNSLASVDRYLADRQREKAARQYRNPIPADTMSAAELAELSDVLKALDTDVANR